MCVYVGGSIQDHRDVRVYILHTTLDPNAGAQGFKLLCNLERQLSGGGEDQCVQPLGGRQEGLQDGQSESSRLP